MFAYSLAELELFVLRVLSAEWVPKCVGLFGEQSLRKKTILVVFFSLFVFNVTLF